MHTERSDHGGATGKKNAGRVGFWLGSTGSRTTWDGLMSSGKDPEKRL
jgi:hypothetical protein